MAKRFAKHQIEPLKAAYQESSHLNKQTKMELAAATGLDVEQIASWFSRKRARQRSRSALADLEVAHARLHRALELSRETEAELQKEVEASREREAELKEENRRLKQRVTVAEGDRQLVSLMKFLNGYWYTYSGRIGSAQVRLVYLWNHKFILNKRFSYILGYVMPSYSEPFQYFCRLFLFEKKKCYSK